MAKLAGMGAKVLGGSAALAAGAQQTGRAVGGLLNGLAAAYHAKEGVKDSIEQFKQGNVVGGLISAGGAVMSAAGAVAGLKSAKTLAGRFAPCHKRRIFP